MTTQLTLLKPPNLPEPKPQLAPELIARIRQDSEAFLLAVNYVNDTRYRRLTDVPTEAMQAARAFLTPVQDEATPPAAPAPVAPCKPYRRTSEVSRCRRRITLLFKRVRQQEPLFFFERIQEKTADNPEYYGVCIIESEGICAVNPGQRLQWQATDRAITRENELRRLGE